MLTEELRKKVITVPTEKFKNSLKGKTFSILGDSTSTGGELYWGTRATNFYASSKVINTGFKDPDNCWWHYLISELGMVLLHNNSWGGRCLTVINDFDDTRFHGNGEGYGGCHIRELRALGDWSNNNGWGNGHLVEAPDYILIRLGINDFDGGKTKDSLDEKAVAYTSEPRLGDYDGSTFMEDIFPKEYLTTVYNHDFAMKEKVDPLLKDFSKAYALTIFRLQMMYPNSKIYCCTINPFDANGKRANFYPEQDDGTDHSVNYPHLVQSLTDFNNRIRQIAKPFGCGIIEHAQCGITYNNFNETMFRESDGRYLHQNKLGSKLMGQATIRALAYT